ncbi:MAG: methyltransferase domain-containing protein [Alphaproteobacteria bacterium]
MSVAPEEAGSDDGAAAAEKPALGTRLKAWWDGVDPRELDLDAADDDVSAVAGDESGDDAADDKVPFLLRLRAWWHGVAVAELLAKGESESGESPEPTQGARASSGSGPEIVKEEAARSERWSNQKLSIVEKVWGDGMLSPGGSEFILRLVNPLGLNASKQLLEIGSGLGGAARIIAAEFDTYVSGFESDATLATTAQARSNDKGMGKRAVIEPYSTAALDQCKTRFDAMFSKEALYLIEDKAALFARLPKLLKQRGEIVFTDFVLGDGKGKALDAWREGEPATPHPWKWDQYAKACAKAGLEVRVHEDLTEEYGAFIIDAWRTFQSTLTADIKPEDARIVMDEIALWHRRRAALESGALRLFRVHVVAP